MRSIETIAPGSVIGLLGGGQLARMTALAARSMGYHIHVLDPDPACAAAALADEVHVAQFDDEEAARRLAKKSSVVTYEIERIAPRVLHAAAQHSILRPSASVLECIQDRASQKSWLESHGYPLGPWMKVSTAEDLENAFRRLGSCRVKSSRNGYDGRSQFRLTTVEDIDSVAQRLPGEAVAEQQLDLAMEISVLIARSPDGSIAVHPPAMNQHEEGILVSSLLPAPIEPRFAEQVTSIARSLAVELTIEGVLVVEMFVTSDGRILINELAPRPHNTFHAAGAACTVGQYEQYVRAICGLPLGSPEAHSAAILINMLGDLWENAPPDFTSLLALPGVSLHLYGKKPRPRRKVGHIVVTGNDAENVLARSQAVMHWMQHRGRPIEPPKPSPALAIA